MSTVITLLVIVAVIWALVAIAKKVENDPKLRNGPRSKPTLPTRTPASPPRPGPPRPPAMTFTIVRRTEPYEPKAPPPRPGSAGNGDFRPTRITVNTTSVCRLYGKKVADCTCERCLKAKNGARR